MSSKPTLQSAREAITEAATPGRSGARGVNNVDNV